MEISNLQFNAFETDFFYTFTYTFHDISCRIIFTTLVASSVNKDKLF